MKFTQAVLEARDSHPSLTIAERNPSLAEKMDRERQSPDVSGGEPHGYGLKIHGGRERDESYRNEPDVSPKEPWVVRMWKSHTGSAKEFAEKVRKISKPIPLSSGFVAYYTVAERNRK